MNAHLPSPTAIALAFGLFAFSSISYSETMTISDAQTTVVQATSTQRVRGAGGGPFNAFNITQVAVAVTIFPGEIYRAPRSWGEQAFKKLIYWNEVDKGGHFAANEQPQLFAEEMRAAFRSLRQ